jgi:hypothetical protein
VIEELAKFSKLRVEDASFPAKLYPGIARSCVHKMRYGTMFYACSEWTPFDEFLILADLIASILSNGGSRFEMADDWPDHTSLS